MILLVDQGIVGWTYGSHIIELLSPGAVEQRTLSALVQGNSGSGGSYFSVEQKRTWQNQ